MSARWVGVAWGLAAALPIVGGLGLIVARGWNAQSSSRFDLDQPAALMGHGRFVEAERLLQTYQERHPDDDRARVMLAQAIQEGPRPRPRRVLELLESPLSLDTRRRALGLLFQGKAWGDLGLHQQAEAAWLAALNLDPLIPEAGFALLSLYDTQGREKDARALALRLHETEPDPRDRILYLLELIRKEVHPIDPGSVAQVLAEAVVQDPDDMHSTLAVGLNQVRASLPDAGLATLKAALNRWPERVEPHVAWLKALEDAGRIDAIPQAVEQAPETVKADPRMARFLGRVAQDHRDWPKAHALYLRAYRDDPGDSDVLYRLGRVLQLEGDPSAREIQQRIDRMLAARERQVALYKEVGTLPNLGVQPRPGLDQEIARIREDLGRPDEARAWHRQALREQPGEVFSLKELERLESPGSAEQSP